MALLPYTAPGVSVQEVSSPTPTPAIPNTTNICLVGPTRGYEVLSVIISFPTGHSAVTFTAPAGGTVIPVVTSTQIFVSAVDTVDPSKGTAAGGGYVQGNSADYTATLSGDSTTVTITPVTGSIIDTAGASILFTYRYLPANNSYFYAQTFTDANSVQTVYGPAWDSTGSTVVTPITYAANLAFQNGADTVIIQPLFKLSTPGDLTTTRLQVTTSDIPTSGNWKDTLTALQVEEGVNVIVPIVGQSMTGVTDGAQLAIYETVLQYLTYMQSIGVYIEAFFGDDDSTSTSVGQAATLRSNANTLSQYKGGTISQAVSYLSPSSYFVLPPGNTSNIPIKVGAEYAAAAVAGLHASFPVTTPITRKTVSGFVGVTEVKGRNEKDLDAGNGLMVLENIGSNSVQVRHAITLNNVDSAHRELSVVRSKFVLIQSVINTFQNALPIVSPTPALVLQTTIVGILDQLERQGIIVTYENVNTSVSNTDPTIGIVSFSYLPLFPLNYVQVSFSIDLTSGTTTVTTP